MATKRLLMEDIREILRRKWVLHRSHREVARSLGISAGKVGQTMVQAQKKQLSWSLVESLSDEALAERLYGCRSPQERRPKPDPEWIHHELKRPGVTLELLHMEYLEAHPTNGYGYTSFCRFYREWLSRQKPVMRQVHKAGEKGFVDYSGKKPQVIDRTTGEVVFVELFVGVLGASNFVYAEASRTQKIPDWISSHVRMFEYWDGVPRALVPDQLKSGVTVADRYEPMAQKSYAEMAEHYSTVILPARPGKPRDKAKVEVSVQIVQRWILARLRHQTFFSLDELNERIRDLCDALNERPMKKYGNKSRRQLFMELEKELLTPLPTARFVYGQWKRARVNIDYHIEFERHYYSVPHALLKEVVELRATATTLEIFHRGKRIASHLRSSKAGLHTTESAHMPKAHHAHAEWTPSRILHWAETIGPHTRLLAEAILKGRPHPEMGYRSCLGILRLSKRYPKERLEAACHRAYTVGARSYRHVDAILKHNLDQHPWSPPTEKPSEVPHHENIRGPNHFN